MILEGQIRKLWEQALILQDYWLTPRRCQSDRYLPDLRTWAQLKAKEPVWYTGSVVLAAKKTGRLRLNVDPGFALTAISGYSTAAGPADNGGSAQMMVFDPARRLRFSANPIVQANILGTGPLPFRLRVPYVWNGTQPVLFIVQNRANAANTVTIVLHGRRDPIASV